MKYTKKVIHIFLSFLLILSTIIVYPVEAWATLPNVGWDTGTTYVPLPLVSLYETLRDGYNDGATPFDFIKESIKNSGFLSPEIPALKDLSSLDQYIGDNQPELKGDTPENTAKNVSQFIVNNTDIVSDNSIKINSNVKNFNNSLINNYVDSYGYTQGFTLDLQGWDFTNYSTFTNLITQNQEDNYLLWFNSIQGVNNWRLLCIPKEQGNNIVCFLKTGNVTNNDNMKYCRITTTSGLQSDPRNIFDNCIVYNGSGSVISSGDNFSTNNVLFALKTGLNSTDFSLTGGNFWLVSWGKSYPIIVQHNVTGLTDQKQDGIGNYYYNDSVWQNYSNSSGDFIFTPTNINTVSYGDTVSYINDYHDTNNNYPDNSTVNNWIENKNEENITNNNGGGSGGSGGDDSGSDSPSDIFGWLKQLGAVLGSLIKGVGEFLTEIVTGLVSAINNLLSGISDLIQNITESIPTVFMDFLGTLFSWLPDEWLALFSASIIFMLLWGIIKTIRGS